MLATRSASFESWVGQKMQVYRPAAARGPAVPDLGVGPLLNMFSSKSSPATCKARLCHPVCPLGCQPVSSAPSHLPSNTCLKADHSGHVRQWSRVMQSSTTPGLVLGPAAQHYYLEPAATLIVSSSPDPPSQLCGPSTLY